MNQNGTSIIFSTHRMEQVEEVCEHIVLINQGQKVLEGRVADVKNRFKDNLYKIKYTGTLPDNLQMTDAADDSYKIIGQDKKSITVQVTEESASNKLLNYLISKGVHIQSFNEILPTLNEIFIKQVGQSEE